MKMKYEAPNMEIIRFENGVIDTTDPAYSDAPVESPNGTPIL